MDPLRIAYEKTALHRLGIPFERAIELQSVRLALAGSVKRVLPPAGGSGGAAGGGLIRNNQGGDMAEVTLTEQKLCKLWDRAESGGDWWGLFTELSDISDVLNASGDPAAAELFKSAAEMALDRRIYEMRAAA